MKKFIVCLLMLIFLASMVFAEDIEITVDGQGLDQPIRLESGQTVAITTDISAGVMIEDVTVESDVGVFAQLLEDNLQLEEGVVYQEDSTVESYVPMPAMLPAGGYDVQIIIEYQKGGVSQLLEKSVPTTIPSTGIVSDMAGALVKTLPDDAVYEIMNALNPQDIPPLDPGITEEEKAELGLEGMQIREISSQEITEELTAEDVSGVVEGANDATRDALGEMNEKEEGTVEKTLKVYEVTDPATGAVTYVSKIIISVSSDSGLNNLVIVEEIPKDVAVDVSELLFSEAPEILQRDPIVKWDFRNLPPDQEKGFSYTVEKKVDSIESVTIAGGDKPSGTAMFVRFLISGGWIVLVVVILGLAVGLPIALSKKKGKKQ